MLEGRFADTSRRRTRDDADGNGEIFAGNFLERLELRICTQGIAHRLRRVGPLHAGVEALGILPEDHHINFRFFKAASRLLANEVQRITGKRQARPRADVEVELLPHGNDGAEVLMAFAPQCGVSSASASFLGFEVIAPKSRLCAGAAVRGCARAQALPSLIQHSQPISA